MEGCGVYGVNGVYGFVCENKTTNVRWMLFELPMLTKKMGIFCLGRGTSTELGRGVIIIVIIYLSLLLFC